MRRVLFTCILFALGGPHVSFGQATNTTNAENGKPLTIQDLKRELENLRSEVDALKTERATLSEDLLTLRGEKADLVTKVAQLSETLNQVAKNDGQFYIPNIRAAMENSNSFRKDLYDITSATVRVQNYTGQRIELYLNGARWDFPLGVSFINMPYGPVRVKFVSFHRDRAWTYTERDWKHIGGRAELTLQIIPGTLDMVRESS